MALLVSIKLTMALAVPVLVFLLLIVGGNFSLLLLNGWTNMYIPPSLAALNMNHLSLTVPLQPTLNGPVYSSSPIS